MRALFVATLFEALYAAGASLFSVLALPEIMMNSNMYTYKSTEMCACVSVST